jgi:succinate dehydrogenase/fumarate reductase flavoprotein subunit
VVPGLCAAGNAATPLTAGTYPAAGLTIGAAVVFGWIAGCGAAKGAEAGA